MAEENYFIDKLDDPFAKSLTGTLWDIGKRFVGSTFDVLKDKQQSAKAANSYVDKYRSRYGLVKLLGMQRGVSLESIYTPVRFLNEISIRQFESIEGLEEIYRERQNRRFQYGECRSKDGITVATENPYLMVLGNPGAGKSTFLRRLGLEAFKGEVGQFQHNFIPVLLELKQFNSESVDLIGALAEEFQHFGFPPSQEFAIKLLEDGKLLVLLDGLDEVPNELTNSVMNAIDNLVTQYEKNRFIASCRIAAYRSNLQHDFQVIELADFDDKQIEQFINNWFSSELDKQSKTAEKCWDTLNQESNKAAKELAQTPLLLTFLCLVYNHRQSFPATRSRLYKNALDLLLEEWAAEKRIQQEVIYEGLHVDLEKEMLAEIAYQNFVDDKLFFEEQQLVKNIRDFLAQTDNIDNPKKIDCKKILNAIAAQQGILVERAEDIYSFSHLTLQEYLTAQYISEDDEYIEKLVTEYLVDQRWKEVFILVAGAKGNADKLLKLMEKVTQQLMNTDKLKKLLDWVTEITDPNPGDFQPVGKRALAIAYAYANAKAYANANSIAYAYANVKTNAIAHVIAIAHAYANVKANANVKTNAIAHTIAIAHAIANVKANAYAEILSGFLTYTLWSQKFQIYQSVNYARLLAKIGEYHKQIPTENDSIEVHKVFTQQIIQTVLTAFHLNSEMLNLSPTVLKSLNNYLYATNLMIECKKAAVRVSKETWQGIESRMLLPIGPDLAKLSYGAI